MKNHVMLVATLCVMEMRSAAHAVTNGPHAIVGWVGNALMVDGSSGTNTTSAREVAEGEISPFLRGGEQSEVSKMPKHPYTGMWVTKDGRIRQELKPDGRYAEARGDRENAYTGRYEVEGNSIQYWDDSGFTADGEFINGVLYHGGMVMRREGVE